jgi:acetyl-CoA carboxylase carboxyltransferase component
MANTKSKSLKELKNELANTSTAKAFIDNLFDSATFAELGAYVKRSTTAADKSEKACDFEGVITGYGAIDGRLVFAFVQDSSRMKGAFGEIQARKICSIYDMAMKAGAPIIGVFDSCGAKIEEGVSAMAAYASVMKKASDASGYIPQIAVVSGVCAGSAATLAAMSDFVIAAKDADMYVTSPFLFENNEKNIGSVERAAECGLCDIVCEGSELSAKVKDLLSFLPENSESEAIVENDDDLNRLTPELAEAFEKGNMYDIIKGVADNGRVFEVASAYAPEMICAFISVGAYSCGVVANNPAVKNGALTPSAAEKASGFVNLCTSFGLPIITLVDSVGTEGTSENEKSAYASSLASLAYSYAQAPAALVTVITGKAYGASGTVFGSKSVGADVVYATENAVISAMSPEAAVSFLYGKEISESETPDTLKKEKIAEWKENNASPITAARLGAVDDIISAEEFRQRICTAIEMMNAQ